MMCATRVSVNLRTAASQVISNGPNGLRSGVIGRVGEKKINVFQGRSKAFKLSIDQASISVFERIIRSEEQQAFAAV